MRQVWLDPRFIQGEKFEIDGDSFHHITNVMRLKLGEEFEALSGQKKALHLKVSGISKKFMTVDVLQTRQLKELAKPRLGLAFCMPKFPVFEDVLEKMVELGVSAIVPLISQNSFIRTEKDISDSRRERWQKINQSACAQSQSAELMELRSPQALQNFAQGVQRGTINPGLKQSCLMAYEGATSPLRPTIKELQNKDLDWVWIIIGPEGGLSEAEAQSVQSIGIPSVSLGDQILRTETACFTLFSVLKYELGILA
jgi:16S rRNA (uracil1498-N3)-methyltransferase